MSIHSQHTVRVVFCDISKELVRELKECFTGVDEHSVVVFHGDFFDAIQKYDAHAFVSPANSFGYMDGGLDMAISKKYGWGLQTLVQDIIRSGYYGELPVGCAFSVQVPDSELLCICAPTMRTPRQLTRESLNAYLSTRAALREACNLAKECDEVFTVVIPGMCTGIGSMPVGIVARHMHAAWWDVCMNLYKQRNTVPGSMNNAMEAHMRALANVQE